MGISLHDHLIVKQPFWKIFYHCLLKIETINIQNTNDIFLCIKNTIFPITNFSLIHIVSNFMHLLSIKVHKKHRTWWWSKTVIVNPKIRQGFRNIYCWSISCQSWLHFFTWYKLYLIFFLQCFVNTRWTKIRLMNKHCM